MTGRLTRHFTCAMLLLSTMTARADEPKLAQRISLGAPAREIALEVRAEQHVTLTLGGKRHTLTTQSVSGARAEAIALTPLARVAIVQLEGSPGPFVALVGGRTGQDVLIEGRTDMHGDLGERRALVVEASPADAAGQRTVVVGTRHEGLSLCSGRPALIDRRQVHAQTLQLERAPFTPAGAPSVDASDVMPSATRPVLRALAVVGSSRVDASTGAQLVPRALLDGTDAAWTSEPYGFVSLRGDGAELPIEALELRFAKEGQRPSELWLLGEGDRVLHVRLPATGEAARVDLGPAWPNRCLALVLGPGKDPKQPVGLAELSAFGPLDRAGSLEALVSQLVQGGPAASDAAATLQAIGPAGARAVATRFDELATREKRRVLPLLAKGLADDAVRARMLEAVRSPDADLSEPALHVLTQAGDAAKPALRELAKDATATGDQAARTLARDPRELGALLSALDVPGGAERPELRRALATLCQRHAGAAEPVLSAWLIAKPSVAARAALVLALVDVQALAALTVPAAEQATADAQAFEDRYRLALAAQRGLTSAALDAWLLGQAKDAEEWMMRHAAFVALWNRTPGPATALAASLASDPYPRVRAQVLGALAKDESQRGKVREIAQRDGWPLVRVAAAEALSPHADGRDTLRAMLEDSAHAVRSAAIDALARQGDGEAWPQVRPHLNAPNEWPDVQAAVLRFAAATCRTELHDDLVALLRRALRPDATDSDQALGAEALRTMLALGGKSAQEGRQIATREGSAPGLKAIVNQAAPSRCGAPHG